MNHNRCSGRQVRQHAKVLEQLFNRLFAKFWGSSRVLCAPFVYGKLYLDLAVVGA